MVQTVENIPEMWRRRRRPHLGLLSYRTTPISSNLNSPAELLNNCKFSTTLPMSKCVSVAVSVSNTTSKTKEELYQRQKPQAFYYNKTARLTLQPFQSGQPINIYDHQTQRWEPGTGIWPAMEPTSSIIKNDRTEGVYHRTQSQLKPKPEERITA